MAIVCTMPGGPVAAGPPTLDAVLARAGAYVTEFQRRLSGIVAEERYVQEVWATRDPLVEPIRRNLRSDLLLVKPSGAREWLQFRDVFEVDGEPVRDRTERLVKLFVEPPDSVDAQIGSIIRESARYNIGSIQRTVNTPVLALTFLEPENQARFKFKRAGDRIPTVAGRDTSAEGHFRVATEVWVIQYSEQRSGTIIRTTDRHDLPSKGRFWIEPSSGQVLMTELVAESRTVRATIDVSYQSEPLVGLLVPIEMRERYDGRRDGSHIEGTAEYGRFRQFRVKVDETFGIFKR